MFSSLLRMRTCQKGETSGSVQMVQPRNILDEGEWLRIRIAATVAGPTTAIFVAAQCSARAGCAPGRAKPWWWWGRPHRSLGDALDWWRATALVLSAGSRLRATSPLNDVLGSAAASAASRRRVYENGN